MEPRIVIPVNPWGHETDAQIWSGRESPPLAEAVELMAGELPASAARADTTGSERPSTQAGEGSEEADAALLNHAKLRSDGSTAPGSTRQPREREGAWGDRWRGGAASLWLSLVQALSRHRKYVWVAAGPLSAAIILVIAEEVADTYEGVPGMLACLCWMAIWWLSEAMPIAFTSLLPLALFPTLGILGADGTARSYVNDTIVLFVGSFMLALAVEKWGLHRRIALKLLLLLGKAAGPKGMGPRLLLLGFCLGPGFISMWISNTATAVMMVPMAVGVLHKFRAGGAQEGQHESRSRALFSPRRGPGGLPPESPRETAGRTGMHSPSRLGSGAMVAVPGAVGAIAHSTPPAPVVYITVATENLDTQNLPRTGGSDPVSAEACSPKGVGDDSDNARRARSTASKEGPPDMGGTASAAQESRTSLHQGGGLEEANAHSPTSPGMVALEVEGPVGVEDAAVAANREAVARYCRGVVLAIAWACSVGGMATIMGTGPNLVLSGVWRDLFPEAPTITFFQWAAFGFPLSMLMLLLLWLLLCILYCPGSSIGPVAAALDLSVIQQEYEDLGPPSFAEKVVLGDFMVLATLWMTHGVPGFEVVFGEKVDDGTFAIIAGMLLFVIPSLAVPGQMILDWATCRRLPWDIVLLLGGGFALSSGVRKSGLSQWLGAHMHALAALPPILLPPAVALLIVVTTEFSSNSATATIFLPILAQVAISIGRHPLLLMLPATIACSFAFMLPVATPPNAIAYATGFVRMADMARSGAVLNIIGLIVLSIFVPTLGAWVFKLDVPASQLLWAHSQAPPAPSTP